MTDVNDYLDELGQVLYTGDHRALEDWVARGPTDPALRAVREAGASGAVLLSFGSAGAHKVVPVAVYAAHAAAAGHDVLFIAPDSERSPSEPRHLGALTIVPAGEPLAKDSLARDPRTVVVGELLDDVAGPWLVERVSEGAPSAVALHGFDLHGVGRKVLSCAPGVSVLRWPPNLVAVHTHYRRDREHRPTWFAQLQANPLAQVPA